MDGFSAISASFKLAEFCLALQEVESENLVFLKLIARVRKDLDEASRERGEKESALKSMLPGGKIEWIDEVILDARGALTCIGSFVERPRIDVAEGKSVTLKHRFEWVLMNHSKFVSRQLLLSTCHQSLLAAIAAMASVPACPTSSHRLAPEPESTKMLPSPSKRRPPRRDVSLTEHPVLSSFDGETAFCASPTSPSSFSSPVEAGGGFESIRNNLQDTRVDPSLPTPDVHSPPPSTTPSFPSSFVEAAGALESNPTNLQDAPFDPSQPTPDIHSPPPSYTASWLPVIQPMSISLDEILLSGEHDEVDALSAAADALDAQGGDISAVSEMVNSLRRTVTLERNRRATARFRSAAEGETKI